MRRAELTDLTGLNRSTIAGLVAELAALGAVVQEPGPQTGGRWPTPGGRPAPRGALADQGRPALAGGPALPRGGPGAGRGRRGRPDLDGLDRARRVRSGP